MHRFLIVLAALAALVGLAAPASSAAVPHVLAGHVLAGQSPRILTGSPFYLQINPNNCLNSNGVDNQLTSDNQAGGCTNWHAVALGGNNFNIANGANNCIHENSANAMTVVSNCSQNGTGFIYGSCGFECYVLNNISFDNYVSVTGPDSGDKVWGGNNHIDWTQS
jgi:hypothetical protein